MRSLFFVCIVLNSRSKGDYVMSCSMLIPKEGVLVGFIIIFFLSIDYFSFKYETINLDNLFIESEIF